MIRQIFNSATGGASLVPIELSNLPTVFTAQVTGTGGQTTLIEGSNFGTDGTWETITADLVVGTQNSEVFQTSFRFMRVNLSGGAQCCITTG